MGRMPFLSLDKTGKLVFPGEGAFVIDNDLDIFHSDYSSLSSPIP